MRTRRLRLMILVPVGLVCGGLASFSGAPVANAATSCTNLGQSPPYVESTSAATTLDPANQRTNAPPAITFSGSNGDQQVAPYSYTVNGYFPSVDQVAWSLSLLAVTAPFLRRTSPSRSPTSWVSSKCRYACGRQAFLRVRIRAISDSLVVG